VNPYRHFHLASFLQIPEELLPIYNSTIAEKCLPKLRQNLGFFSSFYIGDSGQLGWRFLGFSNIDNFLWRFICLGFSEPANFLKYTRIVFSN